MKNNNNYELSLLDDIWKNVPYFNKLIVLSQTEVKKLMENNDSLANFSRAEKEQLLSLLQEKDDRIRYNYIDSLFPDTGPLRRELYPKHISFFDAGKDYTERLFCAGNQTGKTTTGLCEAVFHATGDYPSWWKGKRFDRAVVIWIAGDRGEIIRDSIQQDLIGRTEFGTGLIRKDSIVDTQAMPGVPGGIGQYAIKHKSGNVSKIIMKTYQAGKNAFEAAKVDVIMLDEECPMDIYVECQIRTITTGGTVYCTFTPDSGLTETVLHFMSKAKAGEQSKFVVMVGWDDVPHLTSERKKQLLATIPPHLRDVKTKGVPYLGAGAIYPILEDEFVVDPIKLQPWWPRGYSFDPGWNRTAALWGALNPETDVLYIYDEYYRGQAEAEIHAAAIKNRGEWMVGIADPHGSRAGRGINAESFFEAYDRLGLQLILSHPAGPGSVEIGIQEVYSRLSTGRLKIFRTLQNWLFEYRIYRRDDNGRVVTEHNHLMDCTRYLCLNFASSFSVYQNEYEQEKSASYHDTGRNPYTGY